MFEDGREARVTLGRRLQWIRQNLDLTRDDLAGRLEESADTIKRWELGRTRIPAERIRRIAFALGVTADYLLGDDLPLPVTQAA